jgi:TetR/AcrR family transcriptional regulator, transcriptional repressor for nem operon
MHGRPGLCSRAVTPGTAWKTIVKTYLHPELCEHPERGCPLAALAPELARVDKRMKPQILAELVNFKSRMVPFMPTNGG